MFETSGSRWYDDCRTECPAVAPYCETSGRTERGWRDPGSRARIREEQLAGPASSGPCT